MIMAVILVVCVVAAAIPVLVLALEILLSLAAKGQTCSAGDTQLSRLRVAALVPAHNEEAIISQTLAMIRSQLTDEDIFLVVADNCTDNTASIARDLGAIVLERIDPENRGKGFALDYGIRFLRKNPPDVVIIVDADCMVGPNLIEHLADVSVLENRPAQALYLMENAAGESDLRRRFAEFSWRLKNHARPLGLKLMGMPCQLMGTGMAIPFHQLDKIKMNNANIVEDMQLGIDLASAGYPPVFCQGTTITSYFPETKSAIKNQQTRWEHGHLGMIINNVPRLLVKSIVNRDVRLFALTLDLLVTPLTLLAVFTVSMFTVSGIASLLSEMRISFYISGITLLVFVCSVLMAWFGFGRNILSLRDLMLMSMLLIANPLYIRFFINRQRKWIRTERR